MSAVAIVTVGDEYLISQLAHCYLLIRPRMMRDFTAFAITDTSLRGVFFLNINIIYQTNIVSDL